MNREHIPQGYYGGGTLHRGHLLGRQLGGDGDDLRNLVPLYADVNTPLMRGYEDALAKRLSRGETLYYQVIPHYPGNDPIPDYLTMTWSGSSGNSDSKRLDNVH
ncbi:DNA/RNA non-specific endonuclease [Streptomyces chartreusis]|uniref:DNA/RNA non-specific endonuclease n=1 Tax=Streptomyces chartreusis TaxID=1969 RepID=UPI0034072909